MNHAFHSRCWLGFFSKICFVLMISLALCHSVLAQSENILSVDDAPATAETPTSETARIPSTPAVAETPAFGRTIVLVLGGVSWRDLASLSAPTSTATPALRRILEESALGAARLPASPQAEYSGAAQNEEHFSISMLRAAAILSSGAALPRGGLPETLAQTLGFNELLSRDASGFESTSAALAFARRTGLAPQAGNLLNLGWGASVRHFQDASRDTSQEQGGVLWSSPLGALGAAVHRAGGKTSALGNGEKSLVINGGARLREAALIGSDASGIVDFGDVSLSTLARDKDAPFGVRTNARAMLASLDLALADPRMALVSVEWGDTRRAANYAPFCLPDVAATHRETALRRLDGFAGEVLKRLSKPNDRLILLCVPDLNSHAAQVLPLSFWRPLRGGQGAFLTSQSSETFGLIGLENVHAKIVASLGVAQAEYSAPPLEEIGLPSSSALRISKLVALQSGLEWLARARPLAHAMWCALFIVAAAVSLRALNAPVENGKLENRKSDGGKSQEKLKTLARFLWCATMIFPWLLWLAGLCVETTWRFGGSASWKLWLSLLLVACLMWFLLGATFNWFSRTRLLSTRIAVAWLLLTVIAISIGSFVLPLNALLQHGAPLTASTPAPRVGDIWALLLISATLLGLAAMTRISASGVSQTPFEMHDVNAPHDTNAAPDAIPAGLQVRRAMNVRPALFWAIGVFAILVASRWGNNFPMAIVASVGLGALCLRLWFERAPREMRLTSRRILIGIIVAGIVLLLWQRGGAPLVESTLAVWWPQWLASWGEVWWNCAFIATLILATGSLLPRPRAVLRAYLLPRFSTRAMLGATMMAATLGVLLIGPSAAPLLATFTLGAVVYEAMR